MDNPVSVIEKQAAVASCSEGIGTNDTELSG
jgi:hypothetical protein